MDKKTIIVLRGLPGSGKSTFAKMLDPDGAHSFSEDDYWTTEDGRYLYDAASTPEAHSMMLKRAAMAVGAGVERIVLHTAATRIDTNRWHDLMDAAKRAGYQIFPLILQRDISMPPSVHNVRPEDMDRFRRTMEHGLEVLL